jgi:hypothetical protein
MSEFDTLNDVNNQLKVSYIHEIAELRREVYALRQENKLLLSDVLKLQEAIVDLLCLQKMEDIR